MVGSSITWLNQHVNEVCMMSLKTESHEGNILDGFHFYFKFFGRNMSTPEYV